MYDVIVTNPSWYPLNPWYSMVYSSFFYDIIVANPSWYPPNPWRNMVYSRFFIWYHTFSWWHHRFSWWHHRFSWWHSMLHTMLFHDQYHRYLMPCLCWKSARTPQLPWFWPVHCPAAPEPPASLSVGLFGSTTVAIPYGDMLQRGEREQWQRAAQGWRPLRVTRATGRGQWPSFSAWLLQLTCAPLCGISNFTSTEPKN